MYHIYIYIIVSLCIYCIIYCILCIYIIILDQTISLLHRRANPCNTSWPRKNSHGNASDQPWVTDVWTVKTQLGMVLKGTGQH